MLRTLGAADSIGGRTLVPARDASAAAFYATHGFGASPTDPLHRVLLLKGRAGSLGE